MRLILEDAVGHATDRVADKAADVGPWLRLALLLLGLERPRPAPRNAESRDGEASTRSRLQRCHVQPRLGGPVEHMDDRGKRLCPEVFLRSGIEQSSTHALHQRAVSPLRLAVLL